ncbi:MAG: plasmid pRiA4b ORF-3 family protein [Bacteroidales bacterium]|nr:plasmid pRiA4b ORF-3 family protein [Bacteroidales bacterium]
MRNLFKNQIDTFVSPMFDQSIKDVDKYVLGVELIGAPCRVYREVAAPSDIYLGYLGELLVLSVGWSGAHLHEIIKGNVSYRRQSEIEKHVDEPDFLQNRYRDALRHTLGELLVDKGDSCVLRYDFGDDWIHRVTLIDKLKYDNVSYDEPGLEILGGEGNCPPDDCGGVEGYIRILDILADPKDEEYEMVHEWMECWGYGNFDPHAFNLFECSRRADDYQRMIDAVRQGFFTRF